MRNRILVLLAVFLLPLPLLADTTTTYTYTGNDFKAASAPFTTSDSISGSFTVSTPLADDLSNVTIAPAAFDFTDGVATITDTTSGLDIEAFSISTDASGEITAWDIEFLLSGAEGLKTEVKGPIDIIDQGFSFTSFTSGLIEMDPGTWTVTSDTPEASTLVLLGTGIFGVAGVMRRKFLHL